MKTIKRENSDDDDDEDDDIVDDDDDICDNNIWILLTKLPIMWCLLAHWLIGQCLMPS